MHLSPSSSRSVSTHFTRIARSSGSTGCSAIRQMVTWHAQSVPPAAPTSSRSSRTQCAILECLLISAAPPSFGDYLYRPVIPIRRITKWGTQALHVPIFRLSQVHRPFVRTLERNSKHFSRVPLGRRDPSDLDIIPDLVLLAIRRTRRAGQTRSRPLHSLLDRRSRKR